MPQPVPPSQSSKASLRLISALFGAPQLLGLLALLAIVACSEPSPEQATKIAQEEQIDAAKEAYDDQIEGLGEGGVLQRAEVESPLTLVSVNAGICGLRPNREVVCWGSEDAYAGFSGTFLSISYGGRHVCGVRENGAIECAGSNMSFGGVDTGQARPPGGSFKSVSAGRSHTCAISSDDSIICWGKRRERAGVTTRRKIQEGKRWYIPLLFCRFGQHGTVLGGQSIRRKFSSPWRIFRVRHG